MNCFRGSLTSISISETARTFAEVEEVINAQLNRLDRELSGVDPTLAANLATRRRKIIYHIAALQKKFRKVELTKTRRFGGASIRYSYRFCPRAVCRSEP